MVLFSIDKQTAGKTLKKKKKKYSIRIRRTFKIRDTSATEEKKKKSLTKKKTFMTNAFPEQIQKKDLQCSSQEDTKTLHQNSVTMILK